MENKDVQKIAKMTIQYAKEMNCGRIINYM